MSDEEIRRELILPIRGSGIRYLKCTKCGMIYEHRFCSVTGRFISLRPVGRGKPS